MLKKVSLIGLFKGLIKSQITNKLDDLGGTLSEAFNNLMESEIKYDIGYGISLNLTDTMRPNLTQIYKGERIDIKLLKLIKAIIEKEELDEILASVLTLGMKGSAFATDDPTIHPDFSPFGDMDFNHDYFTNEVQILLSTYTIDNLLYVSQKVGLFIVLSLMKVILFLISISILKEYKQLFLNMVTNIQINLSLLK